MINYTIYNITNSLEYSNKNKFNILYILDLFIVYILLFFVIIKIATIIDNYISITNNNNEIERNEIQDNTL